MTIVVASISILCALCLIGYQLNRIADVLEGELKKLNSGAYTDLLVHLEDRRHKDARRGNKLAQQPSREP